MNPLPEFSSDDSAPSSTWVKLVPSKRKKCVGGWNTPGLASSRTLPSGRSAAAPSAASNCWPAMIGRLGPDDQIPLATSYSAEAPVDPSTNTLPLYMSICGPISFELQLTSCVGVTPALDHLAVAGS